MGILRLFLWPTLLYESASLALIPSLALVNVPSIVTIKDLSALLNEEADNIFKEKEYAWNFSILPGACIK